MLDWRKIESLLITAMRDMDIGTIFDEHETGDKIVEIDEEIKDINLTELAKYLSRELER